MSTIGQRTVLLRRTLGLTQKEFASAGGFSQSNLSLFENDGVVPNLGFIIRISDAFPNINLNWWIQARGSMLVSESAPKIEDIKSMTDVRSVLKEIRESVDDMKRVNIMTSKNRKKK